MKKRLALPVALAAVLSVLLLGGSGLVAQGIKYDNEGKRDPFTSLMKVAKRAEPAKILAPPPLDQRPPGLAGLLVAEVTVTGIAKGPNSQMAVLRGIDDISYFAKEGTKLFNGYIEGIQGDTVVFVREQVDTQGNRKITRITKQMQTEDR